MATRFGFIGRTALLFALLVRVAVVTPCQSQYWSAFTVTPGVTLPLGASAESFSIGGGAEFAWQYPMPFAPAFVVQASLDYSLLPTAVSGSTPNLNLLSLAGGAGVSLDLLPRLTLQSVGILGYGLGIYGSEVGGSLHFAGRAGLFFKVSRSFGLGAGIAYRRYVSQPTPFYQGLQLHLGALIQLGAAATRSNLDFDEIELQPLFPVLYHHYDTHSFGSVTMTNNERGKIANVRVSFFVPQYMEQPKLCASVREMARSETAEIPLFALFTNEVLSITEGTRVAAEIVAEYTYSGEPLTQTVTGSLQLFDRNAITWDEDEKAAAFVTAKDPGVMMFAKQIAGSVREDDLMAVNLPFRIGLGMFEALRLHGLRYVVDPQTPYASLSQETQAIDYLQFPTHTLTYRAGDCDDLSVLFATLLESIGVETAFVTVPGHIFVAFNMNMPPDEAQRIFADSEDLIYRDGQTWVPIEITMVQEGFLQAWARGARQWREHALSGNARFIPIHDAWASYVSVGLPNSPVDVPVPDEEAANLRYRETLTRFIEREIAPRVEVLEERIAAGRTPERWLNSLGVLYAQFGLLEKAKGTFQLAAAEGYHPATINLANVHLLEGDFEQALALFEQAVARDPADPSAHLGLAKVNYELENQGDVRRAYDVVAELDPELAQRFSYLVAGATDSARASAAMMVDTVIWVEEQQDR